MSSLSGMRSVQASSWGVADSLAATVLLYRRRLHCGMRWQSTKKKLTPTYIHGSMLALTGLQSRDTNMTASNPLQATSQSHKLKVTMGLQRRPSETY